MHVTDWQSGLPETPCGKGSMFENTIQIRGIVNAVMNEYKIRTVADVGCGDQNWIHDALPDGVEYTGFDIKPRYVDVLPLDVSRQVLPTGYDLILCICVVNHLSDEHAALAWQMLRGSGSKMILCSYLKYEEPPYSLLKSWVHESTDKKQAEKKLRFNRVWKYGLWRMN